MKYIRQILLLISILSINVMLCGAGLFSGPDIEVDTDKNKVFKSYYIAEILEGKAEDNYGYCCLSGEIIEIEKNKKTVYLSNGNPDLKLELETDDVIDKVEKLKVSDSVLVFGIAKKMFWGKGYYIDVSNISLNNSISRPGNSYYLENGKYVNKDDMVERSLNDGNIKYYIPKSWIDKEVEFNIIENDLGYVDGYQYALNKTPGSDENTPESFFVCYFKYDGNLQKNTPRKKVKPIEKAIAESIEDANIIKFPTTEKKTYYGATYQYYQGQFHDALKVNEDYYTEYVFDQNGEDGIVMYVYVYKKPAHIDDIIFVTRLLEK